MSSPSGFSHLMLPLAGRHLRLCTAVIAFCTLAAGAFAFPSWIGVYGSYERHDDPENPGTYTVLMNQDYWGLHAEVGVQVDGGSWQAHGMSYAGNTSGNSVWQFSPGSSYPEGVEVRYYFHGYDNWGGHIYDNNSGANYTFTTLITGPQVSTRPGIGAIPYATGTTFRVWAPNATDAAVAGTFNSWSATNDVLVSEGDGHWSRDIEGALIGDEYKFVFTWGGNAIWKNDARAYAVTNSVGNSVIADTAYTWQNSFSMPGWNDLVIYEMHIGTFNDAPGGTPGTWQTAIAKLDHLQTLGISAVKVMPVAEFAGDFSWGYNPAHLYAPESVYGSPLDMKEFVDECHERGIAVLLDVVYNHLGPSDLATWCYDGPCFNNGGIYFYDDWRSVTPWGDTRPDYGRTEVRSFLRDNALYWLDEYRLDGLRWDSTVNIRTQNNGGGGDIAEGWSLMQWVNDEVDAASPWKIQIAEDLQNDEWMTKTTGAGGAGFDSQWDAGYVHPIRDAVITGNDADRDMWAVRDAITHSYNGTATQRVIYTESHDEVANGKARVPEEIWPGNAASWYSKKRSTLGAAVTFTSPGVPMMFMGQEMLEDGWFADTDPLDWTKATTHSGIVSLYGDLISLRRNSNSNTGGLRGNNVNVHHVNNTDKVIAFHRWDQGGAGDDVIVILNFNDSGFTNYNIGMPQSGMWRVRFNSDWNGYDSSFGNWSTYDTNAASGGKDGLPYNANVNIGPYTAVVLSQ